jgi:hypothetical protein
MGNNNQKGNYAPNKSQGVCGNSVCEPGFRETKENCPKDCSAE